jgi:hypothetical protein
MLYTPSVRFLKLLECWTAIHHTGVGHATVASDVMLGELIVLRQLDAAEHVGDAGNAEQ